MQFTYGSALAESKSMDNASEQPFLSLQQNPNGFVE